ncbi:hypothetical protein GCM10029964_011880 [Kibdelosporangium lantanae]
MVLLYWVLTLFGVVDMDDDQLAGWGFGGVPLVIVLSVTAVVAWLASLVGTVALTGTSTGVRVGLGVVVLGVATVLGLLVARLCVTPLRRVFHTGPPVSRMDFVGRTCVIRTGTVALDFGQAEVTAADGSTAVVQVRQTGQDRFTAGTVALIYEYDTDGEFFWVAPVETHMTEE